MKAISADLLVDADGIRSRPLVLVQNERIVAVGSKGQIEVPKDAELIDAEGLVLMPGLVDCHVHFQGSAEAGLGFSRETFGTRVIRAAVVEARQLLDAGFTSVMDTGGQIAVHVRNAIDSGILPGPGYWQPVGTYPRLQGTAMQPTCLLNGLRKDNLWAGTWRAESPME